MRQKRIVRVYVYEKKGKREICFLFVLLKIVCVKTATRFFSSTILLTINKLIKFQNSVLIIKQNKVGINKKKEKILSMLVVILFLSYTKSLTIVRN